MTDDPNAEILWLLRRIRHLLASPAGLRFLSLEPLLEGVGPLDLSGISWVIVGGESGPGARPMAEPWVLDIRDQCARAGVAFFFKQWGRARPKSGGRRLQGAVHDALPARPFGRGSDTVP